MAIITANDVRLFTNLTTDDMSDSDIERLIPYATTQLMRDINTRIVREKVEYIDSFRENKIDGSNTAFYAKEWKGKYFSDSNSDGAITIADVTLTKVASSGTESDVTLSTITAASCKIVATAAPSSDSTLYLTYEVANVPLTSLLVKMACAYLVAAVAFSKINVGAASSFSVGEIRVTAGTNSFKEYYGLYSSMIQKINDNMADQIEKEILV